MAYVYQHIRLDTNEVFYVGVGKNKCRISEKRYRNKYWHHIVNKAGYRIDIIAEGITHQEALNLERQLIKTIGRKDLGLGPLVNMTDGGEGILNMSEETRQKIAQSKKGRTHTEEVKQKMSNSHKGKKLSEEHKQKVLSSKSKTKEYKKGSEHGMFGKKRPEFSEKMKGRTFTEDHKQKISLAKKGIEFTEEHKQKLSEVQKNRERQPHSDETRKKMSETRKNKKRGPYSKVKSNLLIINHL